MVFLSPLYCEPWPQAQIACTTWDEIVTSPSLRSSAMTRQSLSMVFPQLHMSRTTILLIRIPHIKAIIAAGWSNLKLHAPQPSCHCSGTPTNLRVLHPCTANPCPPRFALELISPKVWDCLGLLWDRWDRNTGARFSCGHITKATGFSRPTSTITNSLAQAVQIAKTCQNYPLWIEKLSVCTSPCMLWIVNVHFTDISPVD